MKRIAQTLLAVIPQVDRYCDAIAKTNIRRAESSYFSKYDTLQIMEKIVETLRIRVYNMVDN